MSAHRFFAFASPLVVVPAFALTACQGADPPPDPPETSADTGCPALFYQEHLPEYRVSISDGEWDLLMEEFLNRPSPETPDLVEKPYHPIELEYDGERVANAMIRLKGDSSWWQAITMDDNPKMQFVIAFNEIDKDARFKGVRKVEFDMPRDDMSFLHQRLALYYLRRAGVTAQCANNARLVINGAYYGLYTHLERLDKEFLQRHFGEDDEGDLWKGGWKIQTNEDSFTWDRVDALWEAENVTELSALADLETSVTMWAHDALLPNEDGYYNGRANFFLYDHPTRGFIWLAHDLDATFDYLPATHSPVYPPGEGRDFHDRLHWSLVLRDPAWVQRYQAELAIAREAYEVDHLAEVVQTWEAQIAAAAAEDPMKPFTVADHLESVEWLAEFPRHRAAVVDEWLRCFEQGGVDGDGDGFVFCHDCDDANPDRYPGAPEICNGQDDNCDGLTDEPEGGETCP